MLNSEKSYHNAYQLYVGEVDYSELGDSFYLPENHENGEMLLKYFEETEEYEKCSKIIKVFAK